MKLKRILSLALCAALLCMGFACAETFTDMCGREIALDAPAQRIVALTAADCEILCALGAQELLIGRGEYCDYPESVLELPAVQSGAETNIEQIMALQPDVVLMAKMEQSIEQINALEAAGIRVVESDAQDIAGVYEAIAMIGKVVGREAEADALIASMQADFDGLTMLEPGRTVYFEVSPLEWGLWTAGAGTFMDEIAQMLGLENVFADVDGWAQISEEQVLERNPDFIVTITMYEDGAGSVDEIQSRAGWQGLKAVQNGGVLRVDSKEISRPGPRLASAARKLSELVSDK